MSITLSQSWGCRPGNDGARLHAYQFGRILEGRCPEHLTPPHDQLVRLDHCGWCDTCGHGWRADTAIRDVHPFRRGDRLITKVHTVDPARFRLPGMLRPQEIPCE